MITACSPGGGGVLVFDGGGLLLQDAAFPSDTVWCHVTSSPEDSVAQKFSVGSVSLLMLLL